MLVLYDAILCYYSSSTLHPKTCTCQSIIRQYDVCTHSYTCTHPYTCRHTHSHTHTHTHAPTTWRHDVWCVALLVSAILSQHGSLLWLISLPLCVLRSRPTVTLYYIVPNVPIPWESIDTDCRWSLGEAVNIIMSVPNWKTTTMELER